MKLKEALQKLNESNRSYLDSKKKFYVKSTSSERKQRIIYQVEAYLDALDDCKVITYEEYMILFDYFTSGKEIAE